MSVIFPPSRRRQIGLLAIILLSACTAPFFSIGGVTFTGDRLLGLAAVMAVATIALRGGLRWTPVHSALALFAGIQMLTSILAVSAHPQGPKFAAVYIFGFACFALTAACAGAADGARQGARLWITVGAVLGVAGGIIGVLANLWRRPIWGSRATEILTITPLRYIFAPVVTFQEWNLYSSFLVVAFALALWSWRSEVGGYLCWWASMLSVGGIVLGLVFGLTRAAWVDMAALAAFWLWARRPPWRRVTALVLLVAFGLLVQALAVGSSPLSLRMLRPVSTGLDHNMAERFAINTKTIESARESPILGKGAGSGKNVEVKRINRAPLQRVWSGNIVLFVLHDSGLLGLAALVALLAVVARAGQRALSRGPDDATRSVLVPLLAAGVALLFAYQFTHALWLMYPYVYLGLLTASTESGAAGC
jgi:O-antigen ligase